MTSVDHTCPRCDCSRQSSQCLTLSVTQSVWTAGFGGGCTDYYSDDIIFEIHWEIFL